MLPPPEAEAVSAASPPRSVRIAHLLGWANLHWLGLLPALAIFGGTRLGAAGIGAVNVVLFFGLVIAVLAYLAVVYGQNDLPDSPWTALLLLLDGPLFALLALPRGASLPAFGVQAFLVDGVAVWLAVLLTAWTRRDMVEMPGSVTGLALFAIASILALASGYIARVLGHHHVDVALLATGVAWCTFSHSRTLLSRGPTSGAEVHRVPLLVMAGLAMVSFFAAIAVNG